jgi:hypothetical protein
VQVRVEVKVTSKVAHKRRLLLLDHLLEQLREQLKVVDPPLLRHLLQLPRRRVRVNHEVEQLTRRGLSALVHPVTGEDGMLVRTPNTGRESRLLALIDVAGAGSCDGSEAVARVIESRVLLSLHRGGDGTDPAGVTEGERRREGR